VSNQSETQVTSGARGGTRTRRLFSFEHPLLALPAVGFVGAVLFIPLIVLVVYSLWPTTDAGVIVHHWTFSNYTQIFKTSVYTSTLLRSLWFVGCSAALTTALTFPLAYFIATRVPPSRRGLWVLIPILPFWTSYLIRVFAWMNIFGDQGVANTALMKLGLIHSPAAFLGFGRFAIVVTFVYLLFPLTFLTTYIALERSDPALRDAAKDLGASRWRTLARVTLPLARTGLLAGFAMAFITMLGDYATPQLIGGTSGSLFANLIINQFGPSVQWGFGSALTFLMLVAVVVLLLVVRKGSGSVESAGEYTRRFEPRRAGLLRVYAVAFMLFLYAPIALLVLFAFNTANYVGFPITGLTTQWFGAVFSNPQLVSALETSLSIAVVAVGASIVLGTLAAIYLSRAKGRLRAASMAVLGMPLFLPPLVLGLGIIIGLNSLGVQRGYWLIVIGHTVLIVPLVTLVTLARLEGLPANQEAAAMDLGAVPWQALLRITVPQALPAIAAGAMLGFALSMDEFILTFLVTGSTTTLPLYIYGSLRFQVDPSLVALSALLLGFSFVMLIGGALALGGLKGLRGKNRARQSLVELLPTT
jgi:spermidine/putrescine transport system permease protein